jgi:hypothetical protein
MTPQTSSYPGLQATMIYFLFVFAVPLVLGISRKWSCSWHFVSGAFTEHVLKVHSWCSVYLTLFHFLAKLWPTG